MNQLGWLLIFVGAALLGIGLFLVFGPSISWFGRLPGDIVIEGEHTRFYFPIVTCLIVSVVLSALLWIIRNFFH